ncbi:hypothetical protein IQ230_25555 [Gloeocapsopsis crepidinum LEGE 06123]|uniref:Uncharacterized protein n=1 Tax=Gloeocapsopsis crepidinum LEGE 06123 TaxID=588587 RepID=A0ABR9UZ86_9CHRO|nr:hypothetical protein [Gloeocapsopsis crepidinum]MBE9193623.1 hypothetical protein [Gloeocapsopsis crepidinum LEGE 06123]
MQPLVELAVVKNAVLTRSGTVGKTQILLRGILNAVSMVSKLLLVNVCVAVITVILKLLIDTDECVTRSVLTTAHDGLQILTY